MDRDGRTIPLPRWMTVIGSLVLGFHLMALLILVLAAPSGPWPTPFGADMALAPWFAGKLNDFFLPYYLKPLKLTHNYHFLTNRTSTTGVYFTAKLRDAKGEVFLTVEVPDANANAFVRHRQSLLARGLGDDQPVPPMMGESVAAPNQQVNRIKIWDMADGKPRELILREIPEHLVPRDRPVMKTSDWTELLVRSYVRYLARRYQAGSVEIVRHSQEPIPPAALIGDFPAQAFDELISNFGPLPASGK
ncbi:MAG: hypothetical protein NZM31_02730 [Gemmatales bacterium]|nr:hypothetical protein [Gemmatales bacterium]MDW8385915.1 hypothetical protein [Gemmatales bacterium]